MSENSEAITSPQFESLNHLKGNKVFTAHSQIELTEQPFVTLSLSLLEDIKILVKKRLF